MVPDLGTPQSTIGSNNLKIPMSLLTISTIVFFLVYGLAQFVPFKHSGTITGIAAILIGIITLIAAV
jgi:hypothetical protein